MAKQLEIQGTWITSFELASSFEVSEEALLAEAAATAEKFGLKDALIEKWGAKLLNLELIMIMACSENTKGRQRQRESIIRQAEGKKSDTGTSLPSFAGSAEEFDRAMEEILKARKEKKK